MQRNRLPLILCFLLLIESLSSSNTLAVLQAYGTVAFLVSATRPEHFWIDEPLYDSVYPASNATISIYKPDSGSLFEGSSNKKGQMIMKLPVGSYRYEINWFDYGGAWWRGAGSFLIKKDAAAKVRVELGQMSSSGAACGGCSESSIINA